MESVPEVLRRWRHALNNVSLGHVASGVRLTGGKMKICSEHWAMMRKAIDDHGLGSLVAASGREAAQNIQDELEGKDVKFDPLMSMNWHYANEAIRCGGLYVMSARPDDKNDGHYCPICEFVEHDEGFVAQDRINGTAIAMASHARAEGLIPPLS